MLSKNGLWSLRCHWVCALLIPTSVLAGEETPGANAAIRVTISQRGGWCVAETTNFRCWTCQGASPARELAAACEAWRTRLRTAWGVEHTELAWTPCCDVVVHASQSAYCTALARPSDASVGSTRIQFDGERVVQRRIDLRCDAAGWTCDALPHELTHVVLAERFGGRPLPPWADEGMAMLSESPAKRQTRLANLRQNLQQSATYPMRDLLAVRQLPPAHLRDAFYGQSLAVTAWLIGRSSPQDFACFLEAGHEQTLDEALRQQFDVAGVESLEQEWRRWTRSSAPMVVRGLDDAAEPIALAFTGDE